MVVVFISSSSQQDLHILLCFPFQGYPVLTFSYMRALALRDYPLTPKSCDKISSRMYNNRACIIFHYRQRLDYGKEKGFLTIVQCAVVKSRKEEKIGGYAEGALIILFYNKYKT